MRFLSFALLWGLLLGAAPAARAQAPADVLLRTDGAEIRGRVVTISPTTVAYWSGTDTLTIPTAEVFLIRYANGTKELMQAAPDQVGSEVGPLAYFTPAQREQQGRIDAQRCFRANGSFAGAAGTSFLLGPLLGALPAALITTTTVTPRNLSMPHAELLGNDHHYASSYKAQAQKIKTRRTWSGYAVGVGAQLLLLGVMVSTGH